jgi:hypothetical protein
MLYKFKKEKINYIQFIVLFLPAIFIGIYYVVAFYRNVMVFSKYVPINSISNIQLLSNFVNNIYINQTTAVILTFIMIFIITYLLKNHYILNIKEIYIIISFILYTFIYFGLPFIFTKHIDLIVKIKSNYSILIILMLSIGIDKINKNLKLTKIIINFKNKNIVRFNIFTIFIFSFCIFISINTLLFSFKPIHNVSISNNDYNSYIKISDYIIDNQINPVSIIIIGDNPGNNYELLRNQLFYAIIYDYNFTIYEIESEYDLSVLLIGKESSSSAFCIVSERTDSLFKEKVIDILNINNFYQINNYNKSLVLTNFNDELKTINKSLLNDIPFFIFGIFILLAPGIVIMFYNRCNLRILEKIIISFILNISIITLIGSFLDLTFYGITTYSYAFTSIIIMIIYMFNNRWFYENKNKST